jgi:hypothetical protein
VYVKYGAHVQKVVLDTDREIESKNIPTHNHTDERKIYTFLSDESSKTVILKQEKGCL